MHAQIVLFDGFDPLDVIAPYEVLYAGGTACGGAVSVELVSAEGPREMVSGTGVTSGLDLGLYLLEREVGPQIAHAVEELFAYERRGTVWRNEGPVPAGL
ncbi:hypothetical protein [Streptomyces sp. H34-S4]|uniref:hypothetical protein n=1 Tax=Streptomyces sp. H34-S4 TaxID=2996463 RepID=UPI00226ECFD2|nr:hypothetical protein [Streptomyces sp. H34-S4]MCY0936839.1 hypothetical protein [Streptomyces sp. H34-S4]